MEPWGGLRPTSELTRTRSPQDPLWRLRGGTRACVHADKVSSGPAVEDSGGRGPASTLTRTRSPQDPLRRIREDEGPRPNRQEPSLLRTRCGDFRETRARVPTDKNPASSEPTVEDSGGRGPASTLTRTRSPQALLWRLRVDKGPCPHGQEPVSSGHPVEDSRRQEPMSTPTRTRFHQDPL